MIAPHRPDSRPRWGRVTSVRHLGAALVIRVAVPVAGERELTEHFHLRARVALARTHTDHRPDGPPVAGVVRRRVVGALAVTFDVAVATRDAETIATADRAVRMERA